MNEVLNNLINRRSCKNYVTNKYPSSEDVEKIITAGLNAASARNRQDVMFACVTNKEIRDMLSNMNADILGFEGDPFYGAPYVIVVFADSNYNCYKEDGSLAIGNMLTAAEALNLGSCWIHRAYEMFESNEGKLLKKEWNIPESYVGIGNLILGYGLDKLGPKTIKENRVKYIK